MGDLFCRSPAGETLFVATSAFQVVPSVMPHKGPDMSSRDMRLVAAPEEAAGSLWSEPLAWGLCGPFGCCGLARPTTTAAYASPPSVVPSCRMLSAAISPAEPWASRPFRTDGRAQGDGCRAQTGRLSWKARQLSFCSRVSAETGGRPKFSLPTPL